MLTQQMALYRKRCSVNFFLTVCLSRPFRSLSLALSKGVPRNRWFGFTQLGLSHL